MYVKPSLQRFGSFRELTQIGLTNASDGASILSVNSVSGPSGSRGWDARTYGPKSDWEKALEDAQNSVSLVTTS